MQTQQDHVHAYQTLVGRMSSALLRGDTSNGEQPARRTRLGIILGLVLGLLAGVAFWIYGLIRPGGSTVWKQPGVILVEKETGTRFVYQNGALHPVMNQASAYLLRGSTAKIESVSQESLAKVWRAAPIGIAGAPESIPQRKRLVTGPWLLCLRPATDAAGRGGSGGQGGGSGGGQPAAGSQQTGAAQALGLDLRPAVKGIVETVPDTGIVWVADAKDQYIVWKNMRYRVADPSVPVALGLGTAPPPVAPDAWISALPEDRSHPLKAADIPSIGKAGPDIGGLHTAVGDLFVQDGTGGGEQPYVLLRDGLAPVGQTDFALLQARYGVAPRRLTTAAVAAAPHSADVSLKDRSPNLVGSTAHPARDRTACLLQVPVDRTVSSVLVTVATDQTGPAMTKTVGATVKPATGMLVASIPAPATGKPERYLITDLGLKYRVQTDDAITALGYGSVEPVPMAAGVLAAIPSGPTLSRAAVGVREKG